MKALAPTKGILAAMPPTLPLKRLVREPLVIFFGIGTLLFVAHHVLVGDPRTIEVTPGVRAELDRRFRDTNGRPPDSAELQAAVRDWIRGEALYREALREGLDRDDPNVRNVLIEKIQTRRAMEAPKHEPSEAEIEAWLASHRSVYERPLRYAMEWIVFAKGDGKGAGTDASTAAAARETFEQAVAGGADPRFQGRIIYGANMTVDDLGTRLGGEVARMVPGLARGKWQRAAHGDDLLLVRVNEVDGGLPPMAELRPRLILDIVHAEQQQGMERAVEAIIARYKVEGDR